MLNIKNIKSVRKRTTIENPTKDKLILFTENRSGILGDDYYKIAYNEFEQRIIDNVPTPSFNDVLDVNPDSSIRAKFNGVDYATLNDIVAGGTNLYNANGQLEDDRYVQLDTFILNFRNLDNPNPTSSFLIQLNDSGFLGDYNSNTFQLNAGEGLYFLRKNRLLVGDDNSIQFGIRDNIAFGITPNYGDFKALFGTVINDIESSFVGFRLKYTEGIFYQDNRTKTGIKYIDFGEIDPENSTDSADFSNLQWNSLVPKKYVDSVAGANIYTADATIVSGTGERIVDLSTNYLYFYSGEYANAGFNVYIENSSNTQEYLDFDLSNSQMVFRGQNTNPGRITFQANHGNTINNSSIEFKVDNSSGDVVSFYLGGLTDNGAFLSDNTTNKRGIRYVGFNEVDSDDSTNTADFSTLTWNSLIPKKYVDNKFLNGITGTFDIDGVNTMTFENGLLVSTTFATA